MSWFKPSPFRSPHEAARRMVDLLAAEGEIVGTPLTEDEREMLAGAGAISDELSAKARVLVEHIFDKQIDEDSDPRSFSNAMSWATDPEWPNIAEITAQVVTERNPDRRLHGWPWVKDKTQLVGCGLLAVLLMFAAVIIMGIVFHWK
jgi:hypothetical protein